MDNRTEFSKYNTKTNYIKVFKLQEIVVSIGCQSSVGTRHIEENIMYTLKLNILCDDNLLYAMSITDYLIIVLLNFVYY